jgi:hypothetical protein
MNFIFGWYNVLNLFWTGLFTVNTLFNLLFLRRLNMRLFQQGRRTLGSLVLVLVLMVTTACSAPVATRDSETGYSQGVSQSQNYGQLARGDSAPGQDFGNWVVQTSQGLIKDAYVRDNNKLGVVISSQVRPGEVKDLSKSLTQGFRKNFPNQDLTVLIYAPDKKLILTTRYDAQSKQVEYSQPT